ncbi:hypothetical protein [Saccharopolyspora pogona]|uniref:hypothetical protein n=1 Tax=Saccharopolyspora pogona TaxID=333966 RepID=UPI001CC22FED|nr:hypothetical protein [Saccharopolyspora pogona]
MTPNDIWANLPASDEWPADLLELRSSISYSSAMRLTEGLVALLYPVTFDLHSFRILLVVATGHAPEELTSLTEDDVDFVPGGVRLRLVKHRAHKARTREFRAQQDETEVMHSDKASTNANELLRTLMDVMADTRARSTARSPHLFTSAENTLPKGQLPGGELIFEPFETQRRGSGFSLWISASTAAGYPPTAGTPFVAADGLGPAAMSDMRPVLHGCAVTVCRASTAGSDRIPVVPLLTPYWSATLPMALVAAAAYGLIGFVVSAPQTYRILGLGGQVSLAVARESPSPTPRQCEDGVLRRTYCSRRTGRGQRAAPIRTRLGQHVTHAKDQDQPRKKLSFRIMNSWRSSSSDIPPAAIASKYASRGPPGAKVSNIEAKSPPLKAWIPPSGT